jgi:glycerol-3-phosphate acyltransferase PlsY
MINYFLATLSTYVICSIPFGLVLTKIFARKDVRKEGSGNIGATNVVRAAGKKIGYSVFALDFLKGIVALLLAVHVFKTHDPLFINLLAFVAIIGHVFPVWLKFKGGKGVATFIGILALHDLVFVTFVLLGWYVVYYITRMVGLASIILITVIGVFFIFKFNILYIGFILSAMLIVFKHKENIQRILKGSENKF